MVGQAVVARLRARGDEAIAIERGPDGWDPLHGFRDPQALSGLDAIVHLAGESVAGRWTAARREAIRSSRTVGTRTLVEAIASAREPPRTLVCASAVGYFGDRGDAVLGDDAPPGDGFLAEVAAAWEQAAQGASAHGCRVVCLRLGMVLARDGGALARMRPIFRAGMGGRLGGGQQWVSWVHLADVADAFLFALDHAELRGAYNLTAPNPVRNAELTAALGRAWHRPAWMPAPGFMLGLVLGDMAREMLLAGQRVVPTRLQAAGFRFRFEQLDAALAEACADAASVSRTNR